jgi:pimeloyl-ACP methyl ester carboxylesterase/ketosteroid isomerase-like protein
MRLCALAAVVCCGLFATDVEKEKAAVRQVAYTLVGWALDNKNVEALKASLRHDDGFFMFQPDSRSTIKGYQEFTKLIPGWLSPDFKATRTALRDVKVDLSRSGDVAWFWSILEDCGEFKGKPGCWNDCRYTGVLEKRHGRWVIVQAHFSLASDRVIQDYKQRLAAPAEAPKSGYADVNGTRLHYLTAGAGEPLLLLHGGLSSSEEFRGILPGLAAKFRVIALDRGGHGRSADSGKAFHYAARAEEVDAFLKVIGIESVRVLGFSDGGVVGYHLAARYPKRVTKLVAMGANVRVEGMTEKTVAWIRTRMTLEELAADYPQAIQDYRRLAPDPARVGSFITRSRDLWLRDPYVPAEDLKKIDQPVLLVAGDRDEIRMEHLAELRAHPRNSQLPVLPNASHFVLADRSELLKAAALEFLGP